MDIKTYINNFNSCWISKERDIYSKNIIEPFLIGMSTMISHGIAWTWNDIRRLHLEDACNKMFQSSLPRLITINYK